MDWQAGSAVGDSSELSDLTIIKEESPPVPQPATKSRMDNTLVSEESVGSENTLRAIVAAIDEQEIQSRHKRRRIVDCQSSDSEDGALFEPSAGECVLHELALVRQSPTSTAAAAVRKTTPGEQVTALSNTITILADQHKEEKRALENEILVINNRLEATRRDLASTTAELDTTRAALKTAERDIVARKKTCFERDLKLRQSRAMQARNEGNLVTTTRQLETTRRSLATTQAKLTRAEKQLAEVKASLLVTAGKITPAHLGN
jgi:hypothetical protein